MSAATRFVVCKRVAGASGPGAGCPHIVLVTTSLSPPNDSTCQQSHHVAHLLPQLMPACQHAAGAGGLGAGHHVLVTATSWSPPNDATCQHAYTVAHLLPHLCDVPQVPEGLELAVTSMRAAERALVTITDPALAEAPEGEAHHTACPCLSHECRQYSSVTEWLHVDPVTISMLRASPG